MILFENQTPIALEIFSLETIANNETQKDIELVLVDTKTIQEINKEFRGKDVSTDVLSFPLDEEMPHAPLGSIMINAELATQKAEELGHSFQDEVTLLFIHGLLHILGYDHEIDEGEMRAKEEELILQYNLPKSLIIRTQG